MGKSIVEIVIDLMRGSQIRADRAYPGQLMPAVETMVAAVGLKRMDQSNSTATVEVSVMTPGHLGAGECEDNAVWICRLLKSVGGSCSLTKAEHIVGANLFRVSVDAVFHGQETINGWEDVPVAPSFDVQLGNTYLNHAVSFTAYRAVKDENEEIDGTPWHFTVEERFPLDAEEEESPQEPFEITVSRIGITETFSGCVLDIHKRILENDGLRQIREGTANSRKVTDILA